MTHPSGAPCSIGFYYELMAGSDVKTQLSDI